MSAPGTAADLASARGADAAPRRAERDARRAGRRPLGPARLIGTTLTVWILSALGAVSWWPVYRASEMIVAGVVALVLGTAIGLAGAVARLRGPAIVIATVVAFLAVGVPVAVPAEADGILPTAHGLTDLVAGVAVGWKQLLTISLPVGAYEALLVPFFAATLVVVVVAVTIATRASRQECASLPALALFAAGIAVGPTTLGVPVVAGLVLTGVALVWALTARHTRRALAVAATVGGRVGVGRAIVRPALVGTATIALAAVAATALGVLAPAAGTRQVARTTVVRPFDPRDYVSPLSGFRAYEESPTADAAQLRVTGLPTDGFVRIATLDTYDGVVYSVGGSSGASASGTFARVPTTVDESGVGGRQVRIGVTVRGYSGVWVPTVGDLESVTFDGTDASAERGAFFYNRATGTAAVLGGVGSGTRYTLSAVVPDQPSASALASARPGAAKLPTARRVPDAVRDTVTATTADVDGAGAKLVAMVQALRRDGYVSHGVGDDRPSRSGHGADRIQELLTSPLMIGDGEQYAVAAALMAQQIGFPARVVLGFASGQGASSGAQTFTGSDITARIEVDTAQYGWVLIDPNPPVREIPAEQEQTPQPVTRPETVVPPPPAATSAQDTLQPPQSDRSTPPATPLWLQILLAALPWVIGSLAVIALVLLPFGLIVLVKRIRRRRRARAPNDRVRIVGAWDEYRDALVDRGVAVPVAGTRTEVAGAAPGDGGVALAQVADRVVFAPEETDRPTADRMWADARAAIVGLGDGRTRWERFRAATSLRSLRDPDRAERRGSARRSSDVDRTGRTRGTAGRGATRGTTRGMHTGRVRPTRYDVRSSDQDRGRP